jgi:serine/threonine-protein kinase RsbT
MTTATKTESLPIQTSEDVVKVRQQVRAWSVGIGFSLVDQTKIITAASELARNALEYGGGGSMLMEEVLNAPRKGLRLTFSDEGPGIPDIERALSDGFTSGGGLGLGLGGAKRLANEFYITSEVGKGTQVTIVRWNR